MSRNVDLPGVIKKRFASKADESINRRQESLTNAARRRVGRTPATPLERANASRGRMSGAAGGASSSFAANDKGKFVPRTATGRPAGFPGKGVSSNFKPPGFGKKSFNKT